MQLLLCTQCRDILKLIWRARQCACGQCSGLIVERGEKCVGHFTGPALPLETPDLGVQGAIRDGHKPRGAAWRLVLHVVDPKAVEDEVLPSMRDGHRYRPRQEKRRLPKKAKPYALKRR